METLTFRHSNLSRAAGTRATAIVGVVGSGNLEVLVERSEAEGECVLEISTPVRGFDEVWRAVITDFVARFASGGLRFSVNDGGARPDTVMLRLAQATRMMAENDQ